VFLGHSGGLDTDGNELPRLVYVSREKRPGFQHHKKAGAMNALVCPVFFLLSLSLSVHVGVRFFFLGFWGGGFWVTWLHWAGLSHFRSGIHVLHC